MNKKLGMYLMVGAAVALTGCNKKMSPFASDYFTTNPTPLAVVGDQVPATITANVPQKFFKKNAEVTVTPYLVYGTDSTAVASQAYTFQGEKVEGNNPVISYNEGGTVSIPATFAYNPGMMDSELYLDFNVVQGKKSYVLPRVKVGEGVLATATLADASTVDPATAADKYQRIINEKYDADIMFLINQANIRSKELKKEQVTGFNDTVKAASAAANKEIEGIHVSSFASPDGGVKLNEKLSANREKSTLKYVEKNLKDEKVSNYGDLTSEYTAQDWDGFQKLVSQSNIQDKDLILSVLSMYKDPEQREKEIRNLSSVFDQLADEILPQLRYSRITASINTIGRSDDEIKAQYKEDASKLSVDELLYCATLTNDNKQKVEIYSTAAKLYPNDYRCFNNLGKAQFVEGNYDEAKANFEKAAKLAPESNEVKMNLGLIKMLNKDYAGARESFGSAAGVDGLNDAMGVYYIKQGDYQTAVKAFGDTKSNNAALAQILVNDYSAAQATLNAVKNPNATTYYMMAVVAARTSNEQGVYANLRKAISMDSSLKAKAAVDKEFAKYNVANL